VKWNPKKYHYIEDQLREIFSPFGRIEDIIIGTKKNNVAFIVFNSDTAAVRTTLILSTILSSHSVL
jgi:RNA recognition motif-containing protein